VRHMTVTTGFLAMTLLACSHRDYGVEGHPFHEVADAAAFQRQLDETWLAEIEPLPASLAKYALIVLPSTEQLHGYAARQFASAGQAYVDGATMLANDNWLFIGHIVEKRHIFDTTETARAAVTSPSSETYVIWFELADVGQHTWISAPGETKFSEVRFDETGAKDRAELRKRMLAALENYVTRHEGAGL
jgi:hypothetical protein